MSEKPEVCLLKANGNVFNLLAICTRALKRAGKTDQATEMRKRVYKCDSYDEALQIMMEYVEVY